MLKISYFYALMTLCSKPCQTSIKHCFSSSTSWTWQTCCCISANLCHQWRRWLVAQTSLCGYLCESMKFWAFNITPYNAYFILLIIFVNFVNSKQELFPYGNYVQQNFASLPVSVFSRPNKVWQYNGTVDCLLHEVFPSKIYAYM